MEEATLRQCIKYAMKENLSVQFLLPAEGVPERYFEIMNGVNHVKIAPVNHKYSTDIDVLIAHNTQQLTRQVLDSSVILILRTTFEDLKDHRDKLLPLLTRKERTNIVITNVAEMTDQDLEDYKLLLEFLVDHAVDAKIRPADIHLNILTDRILLSAMNNCGAGVETITAAPDGSLHVCPGFYASGGASIGDIKQGAQIINGELFKLSYAPICRVCDSWHCKRCVWLNQQTTLEVNTPGRQQCIVSHLERNAARRLLQLTGEDADDRIPQIDYLDPFEIAKHKY